MPAPTYEVIAASPLTDGIRGDPFPYESLSWVREADGAGGWSTSGLLRGRGVDPGTWQRLRTAVYIVRNDRIVQGGLLTQEEAKIVEEGGDTITFGGRGWWWYYEKKRHVRTLLSFLDPAVEQFDVAEALIDHAHSFTGGNPGAFAGGEGVLVDRNPQDTGRTRRQLYEPQDRMPIGRAVADLAQLHDGFDFELVSSGTEDEIHKTLHLAYPRRGGRTRWVWDTESNAVLLSYRGDGEEGANHATVLGQGEGISMPIAQKADASAFDDDYPLLEHVGAHKGEQYQIQAQVDADLNRLRLGGTELVTVELIDSVDTRLGSFVPGSEVRLIASEGWIEIDGFYRVTSYTVTLDQDGSEKVTANLAPSEAF